MSIITGVNNSSNAVAANQLPDIEKVLVKLKPYQTPLMQLLFLSSKAGKEVTNELGKFSWFEDTFMPHQTTTKTTILALGSPASLTLLTSNCNDLTIFNADDIVLIEETDQMAYVSSRTSSQVVLSHIDGSTSLSSLQIEGGYLKIIGSRNNEYSGVRGTGRNAEVEVFNYLNIFSDSVATTGRYQAGQKWTDSVDHASLVLKKIEELKLQVERYFLFSTLKGYATSGNYRTTWGHGFLGRITSNVNSYSPTLDETTWDAHLQGVFAKGSGRKIHMCGSNQLRELNSIIKAKYEVNPNPVTQIYGVNLTEYVTPFGIVDILWNPVMDGKFKNFGFTLDAENIRLRYMANDNKGSRKFRVEEGVETSGVDGKTDKIMFDVGIEIHNEETHGILRFVE